MENSPLICLTKALGSCTPGGLRRVLAVPSPRQIILNSALLCIVKITLPSLFFPPFFFFPHFLFIFLLFSPPLLASHSPTTPTPIET